MMPLRTPDQSVPQPVGLERSFEELANQWRDETAMMSSASKMASHPAYQSIISMGPPVVPLILRELERETDHWFFALRALTGDDPVPPEDVGNVRKMREAWLAYGRAHGFI